MIAEWRLLIVEVRNPSFANQQSSIAIQVGHRAATGATQQQGYHDEIDHRTVWAGPTTMAEHKHRHVALMFPMGQAYHARLLRGITDYALEDGGWTLSVNSETIPMPMRSLKGWPGHGVIAPLTTGSELQVARTLGLPVVNLSGSLRQTDLPRVMVDHEAVGRLAAEHLLERGFRRFAYYGLKGAWFSNLRGRGFTERIEQAGGEVSVLETAYGSNARHPWHHYAEPLERWLDTFEPPVGLMAADDHRAAMAVEAGLRVRLNVPGDVAVVGVYNNEVTCEFCQVPLSSVSVPGRKVGYEAAALLDRLMAGKRPPKHDVLIAPDGVVQRRSTDVVTAEDPHVATVVHFIREHIGEEFGVEALERLVPVSRRWLERRFRHCFDCTPHEYICRTRVERAKQLLAGSDKLSMRQIAQTCGFSEPRRLRLVFQRITGTTPAEYRRLGSSRP